MHEPKVFGSVCVCARLSRSYECVTLTWLDRTWDSWRNVGAVLADITQQEECKYHLHVRSHSKHRHTPPRYRKWPHSPSNFVTPLVFNTPIFLLGSGLTCTHCFNLPSKTGCIESKRQDDKEECHNINSYQRLTELMVLTHLNPVELPGESVRRQKKTKKTKNLLTWKEFPWKVSLSRY